MLNWLSLRIKRSRSAFTLFSALSYRLSVSGLGTQYGLLASSGRTPLESTYGVSPTVTCQYAILCPSSEGNKSFGLGALFCLSKTTIFYGEMKDFECLICHQVIHLPPLSDLEYTQYPAYHKECMEEMLERDKNKIGGDIV